MSAVVVGKVLASVLVSKVATKIIVEVADGVVGEDAANLLGILGGVVAGGYAYNQLSAGAEVQAGAEALTEGTAVSADSAQAKTLAEQNLAFGPEAAEANQMTRAGLMQRPAVNNPVPTSGALAQPLASPEALAKPPLQQSVQPPVTANTPTNASTQTPIETAQKTPVQKVEAPPPARGNVDAPGGVDAPQKWYEKDWFLASATGAGMNMGTALLAGQDAEDAERERAQIRRENRYTGNVQFPRLMSPPPTYRRSMA